MKLLLDANISWKLIALLVPHFPQVEHVTNINTRQPAPDSRIWDYAKREDFCIVTNDEDFLNLLMQNGFPPKLILLRTGNQSTNFLADVLIRHKEDMLLLDASKEYGLLEIHG
jgi:predicted nuclease of predicted toxin-antitoxin system